MVKLIAVLVAALSAAACGDSVLERYTVNFSCSGSSEVKTVTVAAATSAYGAQAQAVAQVERVCGIGRGSYVIGSAEVVASPAERAAQ